MSEQTEKKTALSPDDQAAFDALPPELQAEIQSELIAKGEQDESGKDAKLVGQSSVDQNKITEEAVEKIQGALSELLPTVFAVAAPNHNYTQAECDRLACASAVVIQKYFPESSKLIGCELVLALTLCSIFGSRIGKPLRIPAPEKQEEKKPDVQ